MKRDKIVNEDVTVNFRLPKPLKLELLKVVSEKNITLSKYLRGILEQHINEINRNPVEDEKSETLNDFTSDFLRFIFWIYRKKENNKREKTDDIDGYIKLIKQSDRILPDDIINELDKVLVDLLRIKTAIGYDKDYYNFPKTYDDNKQLDYNKVEAFFINIDLRELID